jgi:TonB family protein
MNIRRAALLCVATTLLCMPAQAQEAGERAHLLTVPDAQTLSDNFPVVALANGVSGHVALSCTVTPDGESECVASEEVPANMGFGAAAERISRDWRFRAATTEGRSVSSTARVQLEFRNEVDTPQVIRTPIYVDGTRGVQPPAPAPTRISITELLAVLRELTPVSDLDLEQPPGDRFAAWYPPQALEANTDGLALIACAVRSSGTLDCAPERESPEGLGFGQRAVELVTVISASGRPPAPGNVFRVPVDFRLHDDGRPSLRTHFGSARDFNRYYPQIALERQLNGRVIMTCQVQSDRHLDCSVTSETPTGFGFGQAAREMAEDMRVAPESLGLPGLAVGDTMQMPFTFAVSGGS